MDIGIIALISSILTGLITLIAVYLTNKANYKKIVLQTELDKDIRKEELKRNKLEELYIITELWINSHIIYWLPYHHVMMGEITYNEALDMTLKNKEQNNQFCRVKMIVDLYFPSLRVIYDEVIEAQSTVNKIKDDHKREYKKR